MKGKQIAIVVVALAIGALVGSMYVSRNPKGDAQPQPQQARKAPEFILEKLDGSNEFIYSPALLEKKKPIVLDFWASWCPNCNRDVPANVQPLYEKYKDQIEFLGINFQDNINDARAFAAKYNITYPLVSGGDGVAARYGVGITSTKVLIDKDGNIVDQFGTDLTEERLLRLLNEGK